MTLVAPSTRIVLLVDDNRGDRELTRLAFEDAHVSARFVEAQDGLEALRVLAELIARDQLPSLALIDLNMPRMNGWELLGELRRPEFGRMWRVACTGSLTEADHRRALTCGADACVVKPADIEGMDGLMVALSRFLQASDTHPRIA